MKLSSLCGVFICVGFLTASVHLQAQTATTASTNALGPRIAFDNKEYDFGKVLAGTIVKHVFIVSNIGDQTLDVSRVQPGCHCTTAGDWTHKIAPGQTGEIHIQFDSTSFRNNVTKTITVTCNDKTAPTQTIFLKGNIWRQIEVNPQFAYIQVRPDVASNTAVVHITNQSGEPVTVSDPTSANGAFTATLTTNTPGQSYDLTVTAVLPLPPGNTTGTISVKTSLTNMPSVPVTAIAMVQRPVAPVVTQGNGKLPPTQAPAVSGHN